MDLKNWIPIQDSDMFLSCPHFYIENIMTTELNNTTQYRINWNVQSETVVINLIKSTMYSAEHRFQFSSFLYSFIILMREGTRSTDLVPSLIKIMWTPWCSRKDQLPISVRKKTSAWSSFKIYCWCMWWSLSKVPSPFHWLMWKLHSKWPYLTYVKVPYPTEYKFWNNDIISNVSKKTYRRSML